MKTTYDYSNPVLSLLSSTQTSPMTKIELNDSIEYYIDQNIYHTEVEIVKYLHGLGVLTKTDPLIKEQQYWKERKQKSSILLETIINSQERSPDEKECMDVVKILIELQQIFLEIQIVPFSYWINYDFLFIQQQILSLYI